MWKDRGENVVPWNHVAQLFPCGCGCFCPCLCGLVCDHAVEYTGSLGAALLAVVLSKRSYGRFETALQEGLLESLEKVLDDTMQRCVLDQ